MMIKDDIVRQPMLEDVNGSNKCVFLAVKTCIKIS